MSNARNSVQSVANPNFTVPPLTTTASTIVSRRKVQVPVNFPTTYGHNKSSKPYVATFDLSDNEAFVDLFNLVLQIDFTPTWSTSISSSSSSNWPGFSSQSPYLPELVPSFDQTVQALISRLRIGTSQGTVIEEISGYNKWVNIVDAYSRTATFKEQNLRQKSDYSKDIEKDRGLNPYLDGLYTDIGNSAPPSGVTRRLFIHFDHASFINKTRFLPLFLFRNGIRFEIEFEDVNRAFVYEIAAKPPIYRTPQMVGLPLAYSAVSTTSVIPWNKAWFVGPGPHYSNGAQNTETGASTTYAAATNNSQYTTNYGYPRLNGTAGGATEYAVIPVQFSVGRAASTIFSSSFPAIKNMLYTNVPQTNTILNEVSKRVDAMNVRSVLGLASGSLFSDYLVNTFVVIPIQFYENNVLMWKGFTMIALQNLYSAIGTGTSVWKTPYSATFNPNTTFWVRMDSITTPGTYTFTFTKGTGGTNDSTGQGAGIESYGAWPMFNWDCMEALAAQVPYKVLDTPTQFQNYMANAHLLEAEMRIDYDNVQTIYINTATTLINTNAATAHLSSNSLRRRNPLFQHIESMVNYGRSLLTWDYAIDNVQMVLDLVKPATDDYGAFVSQFSTPQGIPYPYKSVLYHSRTLTAGYSGEQQIQVPFACRSLSSLLIVLQDPYANNTGSSLTRTQFPHLSSFMRRGLTRAVVTIGGTDFPLYRLQMDKAGGIEHLLEAESVFGKTATNTFEPSFHGSSLGPIRNYLLAGNFELGASQIQTLAAAKTNPPLVTSAIRDASSLSYIDSSRFILGISFNKDDQNNFVTGMDTTQSGSVFVKLTFQQDAAPTISGSTNDPGADLQRNCVVEVYGMCDTVFTLQNDASLKRM